MHNSVRIRLRPYHITGIIAFIGTGPRDGHFNGANSIAEIIARGTGFEIEATTKFDDICVSCQKRYARSQGSVWGKHHSCVSAENPEVVAQVAEENAYIFRALGLQEGSIISAREWLTLVSEKIPDIQNLPNSGGCAEQDNYLKGIALLKKTYHLRANW